jgi:glycosyltransferase involved in cell wall biosynthesis
VSSPPGFRRLLRDLLPAGLRKTYHRYALQRDFGIEARTGDRLRSTLDRTLPRGLNVVGYFDSPTGVGESARSLARAAEASGLPVARIDAALLGAEPPAGGVFSANLFHVNAEGAGATVEMCGPTLHRGRANVAYWYWETEVFPARWLDRFSYFDEVWVASEFCRRAVARVSPIPVVLMPPAVIVDRTPAAAPPGGPVTFLTVCDARSGAERKNPLGAVRAFARAFPEASGIRLVVKVANAPSVPGLVASLRAAAGRANVQIDDSLASRGDVERLLTECDAYVSLHRSEGFGFPIAEAMALGKPVIATDYSGSRDFVDDATGFPVPFRIVILDRAIGPYDAGTRWAEPDEEQAAAVLQRVAANLAAARERAEVGQRRVASRYGLEPAGRRIRERLERLTARLAARP